MSTKIKRKTVSVKPKKMSIAVANSPSRESNYDTDYFAWIKHQALLLKEGQYSKLDLTHLIEEIDSLGNSEKNALESHLENLFMHLLKIEYQPLMRCLSWDNSVKNARFRINKLIKKNPSLKRYLPEILGDAYFSACLGASSETGLSESVFPKKCPWNIDDVLNPSEEKKSRLDKKSNRKK